jgi:hypothetical protein
MKLISRFLKLFSKKKSRLNNKKKNNKSSNKKNSKKIKRKPSKSKKKYQYYNINNKSTNRLIKKIK